MSESPALFEQRYSVSGKPVFGRLFTLLLHKHKKKEGSLQLFRNFYSIIEGFFEKAILHFFSGSIYQTTK